jgi:uncharacterized OB-fold protein
MIRLQRCTDCTTAQYPPREICGACLSDRLAWDTSDALPARVVARAYLHHSNEPHFRDLLPLTVGLVKFDAGPVAVCFLSATATATATPGDQVQVRLNADNKLEAA